jgi:exopolysaccharide biosynthesis polyprenyl glycosylphosphotransferase
VQRKEVVFRSLLVGINTAMGVLLASHFVWYQALGRTTLLLLALTSSTAVLAWRLVYARFVERGPRVKVAILGDREQERALAQALAAVRHARYRVAGLLGPGPVEPHDGMPLLGRVDKAVEVCRQHRVGTVMVLGCGPLEESHRSALAALRVSGFEIHTGEAALMGLLRRVPLSMVDERWLIQLFDQLDQGRDRVKRVLDIGTALAGLAVFAALMPMLWALVRATSRGPFLFVQPRVGLGNQVFNLYKIRTMTVSSGPVDERWADRGDARTTAIGRLLRRLRLDELPQFWNVLRGDMSVVGPRPEQPKIAEQLDQQIPFFRYRHLVKPGITGWAQIHYGYAGSIEESRTKLSYDIYYVRHHTLTLDIDIMLRTAFVMLARIGSR